MLRYVTGDLFESPAQTLVNTVNTVGVMGKGIALRFKNIYPDMFREYQKLCEQGELTIGNLFLWRTDHKLVLNFPTKKHWRNPSKPEYIRAGLSTFVESYEEMGIHSIAFPPLGCGNGELDFEQVVRPIMDQFLEDLPIRVLIYAPHEQTEPPEHKTPAKTKKWLRSQPRDLAFREVWHDLENLLRRQQSYKTLVKKSPFRAALAEDGVRIEASGKQTVVGREEFLNLWTQLREFGLLTRDSLPAERDRDASYILPVLEELPYTRVVMLSNSYQTFSNNPSWGLALIPPEDSETKQLQLV
jgi:O-acetyl-ADP-ribose deacetylase (regulator of RNase III)